MEQEEIPTPTQRCFIESVIRAIKALSLKLLGPVVLEQGEGSTRVEWRGRPRNIRWDETGPVEPDCEVHRACRVLTRIDPCHIDCNSCMMIWGNGNVMVRQVRYFQIRDEKGYR